MHMKVLSLFFFFDSLDFFVLYGPRFFRSTFGRTLEGREIFGLLENEFKKTLSTDDDEFTETGRPGSVIW